MEKFLSYIIICLICLFLFTSLTVSFAQSSAQTASQIQKSLEDLEKSARLEKRIESGEKSYIKDIVVEGVTLLGSDEVNFLIKPYLKRWLTRNDIQQLIDLIKDLYQKNSQNPPQVSSRIEGRKLIIKVKE
ncbi:MAG: POTRA domain-containing protein [Candidatus Omnitrophica bacterium]|nr:POTRA domain-containing protein [Candidatus Omnitrophota bacterium]